MLVGLGELLRPVNMALTGAVVVVGGILVGRKVSVDLSPLIPAALSAMMVGGGANSLNDFYDRRIDALNRPHRPIPSLRVTPEMAAIWGGMLMVGGVIWGWNLNVTCGIIASGVALLLWAYNVRLKHLPLIGNIVVALSGGLAFVYGATALYHPTYSLFPFLFATLIHLAREIVKDVEDLPGDRSLFSRTLPIVWGVKRSLRLASALLGILIILTVIPFVIHLYGKGYLVLVLLLTDIPLLVVLIQLWMDTQGKRASLWSRALKGAMIGGLIALYVG